MGVIRDIADALKAPAAEFEALNDLCRDVENSEGNLSVSYVAEKARSIAKEKGWLNAEGGVSVDGPILMRYEWSGKLVWVIEFFQMVDAPESKDGSKQVFASIYIDDISGDVVFAERTT